MAPELVARAFGLGRMAVGVLLLLAPGLGRFWVGDVARAPGGKAVVRALGARDLVLGLGLARAVEDGSPSRGWTLGGVAADAVDLLGTLAAGDAVPRSGRLGVTVAAGSGTIVGLWLAKRLG